MGLSARDLSHIFERLRAGLVPERGLDTFAVGIERQRAELGRMLDYVASGEGAVKFLRGGYGCGKTFNARLAALDAQRRGFATSFVVVSDNDLHFHRFDELYRKVVVELSTDTCPRGALGDIVDRWIVKVEDSLIAAGADEDADDFDDTVAQRMGEEVTAATKGAAPEDFVRALRTVFQLKQAGDIPSAGALLSWLGGSSNVAASVKRQAQVKGDVDSSNALAYLHGIVEIIKAAGYQGLLIVIDEAETILRMRRDVRGKSLNGIRQIADAASNYRGLLWLFTGTPEFFDARRGVAGLQPLHDRIALQRHGGFASLKQPQLELTPFDARRLFEVALKLRELFPTSDPAGLRQKVSRGFVEQLVAQVTEGLGGDVGKVPRQFLRKLVDVLDLADDSSVDFDPSKAYGFNEQTLTEDEKRAVQGQPPYDPEPEDEEGYELVGVEW